MAWSLNRGRGTSELAREGQEFAPNNRPKSKSRRVNPALGVTFVVILGAVGVVVAENLVNKSEHKSAVVDASTQTASSQDASQGQDTSAAIAGLEKNAVHPAPLAPPPAKPAAPRLAVDDGQTETHTDPVAPIVQQAWVQYVSDNIQQTQRWTDAQRQALSAGMSVNDSGATESGNGNAVLSNATTTLASGTQNPLAGIVTGGQVSPGAGLSTSASGEGNGTADETTAAQSEKSDYLGNIRSNPDYLPGDRQAPVSNNVMRAGTVIPAVMETGIKSDLPGQILARVSANVYNTPDGSEILIPQGAELIGTYDNQVSTGQSRVLVVWNRIIYPDGSSLDIGSQPGASPDGYAGFHDQVNNHYVRIFGDALLLSVFSAGVQLSQPQASPNSVYSSQQVVAGALGQQLGQTGENLINRDSAIAPTITVRPGYPFDVMITQDLVIRPWASEASLHLAADVVGDDSSAPTWVAEPLQDNGLSSPQYAQQAAAANNPVYAAPPSPLTSTPLPSAAAAPMAAASSVNAAPNTPRSLMGAVSDGAGNPRPAPSSSSTYVPPTTASPANSAPITVSAEPPPAPPPPAPTWTLQPGQLVGRQIQSWGQANGWNVIWNVGQDWPVPMAGATFKGNFATAAGQVIQDLSADGAPVHATFYQGNHTLVITSSGASQ